LYNVIVNFKNCRIYEQVCGQNQPSRIIPRRPIMRRFIKEIIEAWQEARQAYVKAHMVDGHWL